MGELWRRISLPLQPPPSRRGTRGRHGVPSRDGGPRRPQQLRQHAAHARAGPRSLGLDLARSPRAGPALRRPHPRPRARLHPHGRARARHRHRRERIRIQPLQHGRAQAAPGPRSRIPRAPRTPFAQLLHQRDGLSIVPLLSQHARTLSAAMAVLGVPPMQIDDDLQLTSASFVTPNYFTELGTPAAYGRLFEPSRDNSPAAPPAVDSQLRALAAPLLRRSLHHWPRHSHQQEACHHHWHYCLTPSPASVVSIPSSGCRSPSSRISSKAARPSPTGTTRAVRMWGRLAPGVSAKPPSRSCAPSPISCASSIPKPSGTTNSSRALPAATCRSCSREMYQRRRDGRRAHAAHPGRRLRQSRRPHACASRRAPARDRNSHRNRRRPRAHPPSALHGKPPARRHLVRLPVSLSAVVVMRLLLTAPDTPRWLSAVPDWRVLLFTAVVTCSRRRFFRSRAGTADCAPATAQDDRAPSAGRRAGRRKLHTADRRRRCWFVPRSMRSTPTPASVTAADLRRSAAGQARLHS